MKRATGSVGRRLSGAKRRLESWLGKKPAAKRAATGSGASLREGAIRERTVDVDLDAGRLAADEGLTALARALKNRDPAVRARALGVIVELSGARATRLLKAMMFDPDATVRRAAAAACTRVGGLGVVSSLIVALRDPDAGVRRAAAAAIGKITDREVELEPQEARITLERQAELKAWWKEQRIAELVAD